MASEEVIQKNVGIWIRVSTDIQARGDSPEHHEKRARLYAEAREWKVREVYHLEAVSGKAVLEHPETERMLEDRTHLRPDLFEACSIGPKYSRAVGDR